MQFLTYLFFRALIAFISLLPFSWVYQISNGLAWLFKKIGYRKKVVHGNLKRCFPEKTPAEIEEIARLSYRNFTDLICESLKSPSMPLSLFIEKRMVMKGGELIRNFKKAGRSVVLCGGHYCNWEWGPYSLPNAVGLPALTPYKKIANRYINDYLTKKREQAGVEMISMEDTFKRVESDKDIPTVFVLIADQSPSNRQRAQWVDFMGQETPCLPGPDVIARTHNYPVVYFEINRENRGIYTVNFQLLAENPNQLAEGAVNQRFMSALEKTIRTRPENWLWSHKRWKYSKKDV